MKRYNIVPNDSPDDIRVLEEAKDGEWIRYKDAALARIPYGWRHPEQPILVIIVEHDTHDAFTSNGAIIMEQYTKANPEEVMDRAKMFADGGKYGRVWVGEVDSINAVPAMVAIPVQAE